MNDEDGHSSQNTGVGAIKDSREAHDSMKFSNVKSLTAIEARRKFQVTPRGTDRFDKTSIYRSELPTMDYTDLSSASIFGDFIPKCGPGSWQIRHDRVENEFYPDSNCKSVRGRAPVVAAAADIPNYLLQSQGPPLQTRTLLTPDGNNSVASNNSPFPPLLNGITSQQSVFSVPINNADAGAAFNNQFQNTQSIIHGNLINHSQKGGGTYLLTSNGIQKCFRRMRIVCTGVNIEDIDQYNLLLSMMAKSTAPAEWRDTYGFFMEGYRDEQNWDHWLTASAWSAWVKPNQLYTNGTEHSGVGKRYNMRPFSGFLDCEKFFPAKYAGQVMFEFYFEDPRNVFIASNFRWRTQLDLPIGDAQITFAQFNEITGKNPPLAADSTQNSMNTLQQQLIAAVNQDWRKNRAQDFQTCFPNPDYEWVNMRFHFDAIVPVQEYDKKLLEKIESSGIEILYNTYAHHSRGQATFTGNTMQNFQERSVSIKGGILGIITDDDLYDPRSEMANFKSLHCKRYHWKIGGEQIPPQDVIVDDDSGWGLGGVEMFDEFQRGWNRQNDIMPGGLITYYNFLRRLQPAFLKAVQDNTQQNIITNGEYEIEKGVYEDTPDEFYLKQKYGPGGSTLFMLQLEKNVGQISGFDAHSANVDIEIHMTLPSNTSAVNNASFFYAMPVGGNLTGTRAMGNGTNLLYPYYSKQRAFTVAGYNDPYGLYGTLCPKDPPSGYTMHFFVHCDAILFIKRVGSIEVRK